MSTIAKKVPIPNTARFKPYYDTQELVQNTSTYNFFPATLTKDITKNNYVSNPFPGKEERIIVGLSFTAVKQFIIEDTGNSIHADRISNALKHAGVVFTMDNDYKQALRAPITEFANFNGTRIETSKATAYVNSAIVTAYDTVLLLKPSNMRRLPNPVRIAPNQTIDLEVNFDDSSDFPTSTNWTDATQGKLYLRATLWLAEVNKN